jgi:hypothetical protein
MLAIFEGPAAALRCAAAIRSSAASHDLQIRAGVHVGEVDLVGAAVEGLAVHEAARIMAAAGPQEILASEITRSVLMSSGIELKERGLHSLKGLPGERRLFSSPSGVSVADGDGVRASISHVATRSPIARWGVQDFEPATHGLKARSLGVLSLLVRGLKPALTSGLFFTTARHFPVFPGTSRDPLRDPKSGGLRHFIREALRGGAQPPRWRTYRRRAAIQEKLRNPAESYLQPGMLVVWPGR